MVSELRWLTLHVFCCWKRTALLSTHTLGAMTVACGVVFFSSQNMCMCGLHLLECVTFLQAVSEAVSCLHQWCHIVEKGSQISSKNMCMCGLNLLECVTVLQSVSEAVSCLHQWCHIVEKGSQISSKNMCMCGLNLLECVTVLQSVSEAVSCLHQWCHIIVEKGSQIIILCLSNVSREMLPTPSLHTPSTDRLILSKALDQGSCQMQSTASVIGHHRPDSAIPLRP
jgi:GTP:adenosylcobinamide-phosphate guanylyltransferase